mgnify:CR=1 FL=1
MLNRYAIKGVERRVRGMFTDSIYNHARFFSVWELKRMIYDLVGHVPITWRTVCQLPLPSGKLPNDLLAQFLQAAEIHDPAVLVYPGVGEDTAAVDVSGEEVLVLKSDPVTFVTDEGEIKREHQNIVREDFCDYLGEVQAFDASLGILLEELERIGELENTLIAVSGTATACAAVSSRPPDALTLRSYSSDGVPVGTVAVAVVTDDHASVRTFLFPGGRELVRSQAATAALNMLRLLLVMEANGSGRSG